MEQISNQQASSQNSSTFSNNNKNKIIHHQHQMTFKTRRELLIYYHYRNAYLCFAKGCKQFGWNIQEFKFKSWQQFLQYVHKRADRVKNKLINMSAHQKWNIQNKILYSCMYCHKNFDKACSLGGHISSVHSQKRRSLKRFNQNKQLQPNKLKKNNVCQYENEFIQWNNNQISFEKQLNDIQ